jgi:hypothetical protein
MEVPNGYDASRTHTLADTTRYAGVSQMTLFFRVFSVPTLRYFLIMKTVTTSHGESFLSRVPTSTGTSYAELSNHEDRDY